MDGLTVKPGCKWLWEAGPEDVSSRFNEEEFRSRVTHVSDEKLFTMLVLGEVAFPAKTLLLVRSEIGRRRLECRVKVDPRSPASTFIRLLNPAFHMDFNVRFGTTFDYPNLLRGDGFVSVCPEGLKLMGLRDCFSKAAFYGDVVRRLFRWLARRPTVEWDAGHTLAETITCSFGEIVAFRRRNEHLAEVIFTRKGHRPARVRFNIRDERLLTHLMRMVSRDPPATTSCLASESAYLNATGFCTMGLR